MRVFSLAPDPSSTSTQFQADHLIAARVVLRSGAVAELGPAELALAYRSSTLPEGAVIVSAQFRAEAGDPAALAQRMEEQIARRDA